MHLQIDYIFIWMQMKRIYKVQLISKSEEDKNEEELYAEFENELIAQETRRMIAEQTKKCPRDDSSKGVIINDC